MKNGTSVLSIHLDQVSARSVGWPLVYFFLLNCPVTCCLDPFFHLQKFFHLLPLFSHNRPGLSLWQVPPISFLYLPHIFLSPFYRPGLSLWQVPPISFLYLPHTNLSLSYRPGLSPPSLSSTFPTPISPLPTGPACHCGRSRLSLSSTFPTPISTHPIGPACHCGRSRLFPSSSFSTPPPFLYLIGPYLSPLPPLHQSLPTL